MGEARFPGHLPAVEQSLWSDIVGSMPKGTYTVADEALLEKVVTSQALARKCREVLARDGMTIVTKTGMMRHPLLMVLNQSLSQVQQACESLGLSPMSRNRLVAPVDRAGEGGADLEDLFGADLTDTSIQPEPEEPQEPEPEAPINPAADEARDIITARVRMREYGIES
jgi:P27 family predicted phage terminase small subunit